MASDKKECFSRLELVTGEAMLERLGQTRVIIFGLGGVGSWCAESLVRSGIGHITLVDPDNVAPSNINRQLPAMTSTIGRPKVEVLADRFSDINPDIEVDIRVESYTSTSAQSFHIKDYDYVIDAIDSLADKAALILECCSPESAPRRGFFSSMGAARKLDPLQIRTAEFWKVEGCPLARALRTLFRRSDTYPKHKFTCVYSPERLEHRTEGTKGINGTFAPATAIFGNVLASLILRKELSQA